MLNDHLMVRTGSALFPLSSFVACMTLIRSLIGSVLRSLPEKTITTISFLQLFSGLLLMRIAGSLSLAVPGLVLLGAGLAAGFPVMLGIAGERFRELSGTAFSFVMSVALLGNMIVNYLMGLIAGRFGISNLTTVAFTELIMQVILFTFIIRILNKNKS